MTRPLMTVSRLTLLTAAVLLVACGTPQVKPQPLKRLDGQDQAKGPSSRPAEDEASYWRGRKDLITAPAPQPAQPLRLPPVKEAPLKNGLQLLLLPDHSLPLVDVQLAIRAGAIDDPRELVGLAEFTAAMLRQGTRRRSADRISATIDDAGAQLAVDSDYEVTTLHCRARTPSLPLCLSVIAELVQQPSFPKGEMGEIRDRLLSSVKTIRDDPATLASVHFDAQIYGDGHPGAWVKSERSVRRIRRGDLVRFHAQHYRPERSILAVSGDVTPKTLDRAIRRAFAGWRAGKAAPPRHLPPLKRPGSGLRVLLVDKPDLSQSFFTLGHEGIRRKDPDRHAVLLMNYVLGGGGFSSRLMEVVRAKGGKTYGIRSSFYRAEDDGTFSVTSFTRNDQLVATLQLVRQELKRIKGAPPTAEELAAAKGKITGGYPIQLKTAAALARRLMMAKLWGLPRSEVEQLPLLVQRLTLKQVAQAASEHVHPDHLVAAVVGKAAVVAPLLRKAKIPFETINFLAPVSASRRKELSRQAEAPITDAENKRGRALLLKAVKRAGGRKRLAAVKTLLLQGTARVTAKGQTLSGAYLARIIPPDQLRIELSLNPVAMVQVLDHDKAWIQVGPQRRQLPAMLVARWKAMVWREPSLVLRNATGADVRVKPLDLPHLGPKKLALRVVPKGLPAATLILDRATLRLLEIRHVDRRGNTRTARLSKHRRVQGILVPHQINTTDGGRRQEVTLEKVTINAKLTPADISGGAKAR